MDKPLPPSKGGKHTPDARAKMILAKVDGYEQRQAAWAKRTGSRIRHSHAGLDPDFDENL